MAKKHSEVVIASTDDADRALQRIGELRRHIALAEKDADEKVAEIREELLSDTELTREALAQNEAALQEWGGENKHLFVKPRSMEMNWGTVGFSWTPWKVVILGRLKAETVIEKIRAAKMTSLLRPKVEINREAASNYLNSDLAKVGLRKIRRDEFFFEVKEIEVK